jgi:hypothetical protein
MSQAMRIADLRKMAAKCRRLGQYINDEDTERALLDMAEEYERKARCMDLQARPTA